jgi:hypothetical protein
MNFSPVISVTQLQGNVTEFTHTQLDPSLHCKTVFIHKNDQGFFEQLSRISKNLECPLMISHLLAVSFQLL